MTESAYPMIAVDEALHIVLEQTMPLTPVDMVLDDALEHVLARDVLAREPLPPFPASVKDGYAVVATDGPGIYPLAGEVRAGKMSGFEVKPGTVAYITTGAPLPPGADAVVMVEETERVISDSDGTPRVRVQRAVQTGDDVRPVGIDVAEGQEVLRAGERLGPAEIGLLATVGATYVSVYPAPKVAVLSTGDELVDPGQAVGPGQIRDSNRAMLCAAVSASGGVPIDLGIAGDSQAELEQRVRRGLGSADILITSGGVSMGDLDLIKPLLAHEGRVHFGRIRMKPGKPLTFATSEFREFSGERNGDTGRRRRLIFGLPGNPVSSLVTFYLFVVPAMRKLAGWDNPNLTRVQAYLQDDLELDPYRPEYHRATVRWDEALHDGQGGYVAYSTGKQASSRLLSMRSANALLELPQAEGVLRQGEMVTALLVNS